ncbi:MAG: M4 family metallopeptidase [Flavobacteriaceae bacterium]|nr:M4 family metallopeptidase [Flavobacteriaceae bacterium]
MWENETNEEFIKQFTNDPKATYLPEGELVLIRENVLNESSKIVLAYKISIYAELPYSKNTVYVNADTGKIILSNPLLSHAEGTAQTRYSGAKTIETAEIGGSQFKLFDNTRGGGIRTYDMNGGTNYGAAISFIDNDNNWSEYNNSNKDNAALDAHWGAMMVYDYFLQEHGWDSYDGNGAIIKSYVHFNGNYDNAFWDPTMKIMSYGDGSIKFDALTSLDVVAHEIGHGINQFSSQLVNYSEPGALGEGISDIWGAMVELFAAPEKDTYLIGEDITLNQNALRSLSNPKIFGNPDTYVGTNWYSGSDSSIFVHRNSGVIGHWFYLLAEGSSATDEINDNSDTFSFTGIGVEKASNILFQAQHMYFNNPNMGYIEASNLTIQATEDLYGANSLETIRVKNAWYAVGIGNLISNDDDLLQGDDCTCFNINTTFTLDTNIVNVNLPVTWQVSPNLQIVQSSNTAVTVKATSNAIRASGFVIANVGGVPITRNVWVGKTNAPSKILGPTSVLYGALVNYYSNQIEGATSYQWHLPYPYDPNATTTVDPTQWGIISGGNTRYLMAIVGPNDGLVQLMGVNKCGVGSSKNIYVTISSGGNPPGGGGIPISTFGADDSEKVVAYPNPVKDELFISFESNSNTSVNLFNLNGKLVYSNNTSLNIELIDTSILPNSVYFLQIIGETNIIKKIIVKH